MQRLEVSGAVRHIYIYIYIYVIRRLKVNDNDFINSHSCVYYTEHVYKDCQCEKLCSILSFVVILLKFSLRS
jgi:hypothetical protein